MEENNVEKALEKFKKDKFILLKNGRCYEHIIFENNSKRNLMTFFREKDIIELTQEEYIDFMIKKSNHKLFDLIKEIGYKYEIVEDKLIINL